MKALRCLLAAVVLVLLMPAAPAAAAPAAPASTLAAPAAPNVDVWGTACNIILTPILGATRGACTAGKIAAEKGKDEIDEALQETIVKPMADGMGEFTAQVLKTGLTWWLTTPSVQVKDSGVTHEETGKMPDGTTVTFSLQALMLGIGQIIAVLLVMFAGFKAMIQRKGKPLADALQGMLINVLVCTLGIVVIDSLLIASDQLTSAIINVAFQDSDKLSERVIAMLLPNTFNAMAILVLALIVLLIGVVQLGLNFLRQAAIPIQALLLPIAGAGQIGGERTRQWLPRLYTSIFVVIAYKPMAALIISAGFVELANGNEIVDWLRGVVTLILSIIALKSLIGLFSPLGMQMANATGGGFSSALHSAGALAAFGGGKGGGGAEGTSAVKHAQMMDKGGPAAGGAAGGAAAGGAAAANPYTAAAQAGIAVGQATKNAAAGAMSGQDGAVPPQRDGAAPAAGSGRDGQGQGGGSPQSGPAAGASGGGGAPAGAGTGGGSSAGGVTIAVRAAEAGHQAAQNNRTKGNRQ
ncbi:hypothetical protein [Streptomyces atacamensis]|uniref:hypothetical protein n=1 Tax=Streptomyces atacamensis TaxID=531966 RepID=UPI00399C6E6A